MDPLVYNKPDVPLMDSGPLKPSVSIAIWFRCQSHTYIRSDNYKFKPLGAMQVHYAFSQPTVGMQQLYLCTYDIGICLRPVVTGLSVWLRGGEMVERDVILMMYAGPLTTIDV